MYLPRAHDAARSTLNTASAYVRPARRLGAELRAASRGELVVLRLAVVLGESPLGLHPARGPRVGAARRRARGPRRSASRPTSRESSRDGVAVSWPEDERLEHQHVERALEECEVTGWRHWRFPGNVPGKGAQKSPDGQATRDIRHSTSAEGWLERERARGGHASCGITVASESGREIGSRATRRSAHGGPAMTEYARRSIVDRMRGAALLDVATYEEVEHDNEATGQAAVVVVIVADLHGDRRGLARWSVDHHRRRSGAVLGVAVLVGDDLRDRRQAAGRHGDVGRAAPHDRVRAGTGRAHDLRDHPDPRRAGARGGRGLAAVHRRSSRFVRRSISRRGRRF